MWRSRLCALAACLLAVVVAGAQDIDLKAVVKKAVEAHGGEAELGKFTAGTSKYKGAMKILGFNTDVTGENAFQKPDKFRNSMTIGIMGKNIEVVTVFDGKSFWVASQGQTKEVKDEKTINEVKQSLLTEVGSNLMEITKEPFQLSSIGEVKVKGKDTIGIRVSKKGQRDISYYFDKSTGLLAKTETRSFDPMSGQEVTQEKIITEYQAKGKLKVGKRVEILKDGEAFMDIEITDLQTLEKLDDSVFAKP